MPSGVRNRSPITLVALVSRARPCAASASFSTCWSATENVTSMENVSAAPSGSSGSESVTEYSYVRAPTISAGVPLRTRVAGSKDRPAGSSGDSEYDSSPLPPVASGRASAAIAWLRARRRPAIRAPAKLGAVSAATATANVRLALSGPCASESVTV